MKKSIFLTCGALLLAVVASGQSGNPFDWIDLINNADSAEAIFALLSTISAGLTMLVTQVAKYIPGIKELKGKYITLLALAIVVIAAAIKYGTNVLWTAPFIWMVATTVYDKFFKPEKPKGPIKTQPV